MLNGVVRPGRLHDRDGVGVAEADRVAEFVLGGVDDPLLGVAVLGVEQVGAVEVDVAAHEVAGGGVDRHVGQPGRLVVLAHRGGDDVGGLLIGNNGEGEGAGGVPVGDRFLHRLV